MKKLTLPLIALCLSALATLMVSSCQSDDGIGTDKEATLGWRANPNSILYPASAHPFGKSYEEWGQLFSATAYTMDCPGLDIPQVFTLDNNVVAPYLSFSESGMDITITHDQAIFMPTIFYVNDYPCPYPDFEPAEGQSLEDFLQEGIAPYIDVVENIDVVFDGIPLGDITEDYRFISDLFYFTGNPDLANCFDLCITGEPQAGVAAGFYIMFKKMNIGVHTITVHGSIPEYEYEWDLTFNITVQ